MLTVLAAMSAALAFLSGIVVIGNGNHFQYTLRDILQGRDNALLYIWITASTMFSMAHLAVLMQYGFKYDFGYKSSETPVWMALHATVGLLFVFAHVYIKQTLSNADRKPRFLWGAMKDAHA